MSDQFVNAANERMGAIERLLKGLPGIRGYVDKEMRRDADKRLRDLIAQELEAQKQALLSVQNTLLENQGLLWLDNVDRSVQKLQTLIDRIRTASYGYAGLFDPVRIREEQLDALNRFDQTIAERVVDVKMAVNALGQAVNENGDIGSQIRKLTDLLAELNTLYSKRHEAILSPGLLETPGYMEEEIEPSEPQDSQES
jgi:hypothetical protein